MALRKMSPAACVIFPRKSDGVLSDSEKVAWGAGATFVLPAQPQTRNSNYMFVLPAYPS